MILVAPLAGDLLLEQIEQHGHTAEHVRGSRDHPRPNRAILFESVKRPRIVVEAFGKELQLLALMDLVSLRRRIELRALWEMRRVTGHAQRRLLMHVRNAVEHAAASRR